MPERVDVAGLLAATLGDAVQMLQRAGKAGGMHVSAVALEPSLLEQCLTLCISSERRQAQPIRTVHHFACSGGTLISKCIATLPNVQLLSEVDPLSTLPQQENRTKFVPTDMIGLVRRSTRGGEDELLVQMFRSALRVLYDATVAKGQRLVLRDHAHSHFCIGDGVPVRPGLRQLLPPDLPSLSLVTVRHPLDSFASLVTNKWVHFNPPTLDEYARRYCDFLGLYRDLPRVRYEEFVTDPNEALSRVCEVLQLPMQDGAGDLFDLFEISGDSGRHSESISLRPRRPEAQALAGKAHASTSMALLCSQLGYELD